MANLKTREKRRLERLRKSRHADEIEQEISLLPEDDIPALEEKETPDEPELEVAKEIRKDYGEPMMGATSWEEIDSMKAMREQAEQVREVTYSVQDLVYNITSNPAMSPDEKGKAIVKAGSGYGQRVKQIVGDKVEKEADMDVLQLQAILAMDSRHTSLVEKAGDFLSKTFKRVETESKTFVRMLLKETIASLEKPQEDGNGHLSRENIPALIEKTKAMGIGVSDSIMIEKDKSGEWRAVLFPTNNFEDRDKEIVSEAAHLEYVDWVTKNMDCAPVFATWHKPGTARTHPMDFVGYENGIMITSLPLTEVEASRLLKMQIQTDIGLSIGGLALERDGNIITKYRMFEVSDLPLERAANPFTELELISKEAQMDTFKYLSEMLGDENRAKTIVEKMALTQKELRAAGVQEKEVKTPEEPATPAPAKAATPEIPMDELIEKLSKEFGMTELSDMIKGLMETSEKVPVLEALVKELMSGNEEKLADMIRPPVAGSYAWLEKRASASKENVLDETKDEDKKLKKSVPEIGWLSEATGTQPVIQQ